MTAPIWCRAYKSLKPTGFLYATAEHFDDGGDRQKEHESNRYYSGNGEAKSASVTVYVTQLR